MVVLTRTATYRITTKIWLEIITAYSYRLPSMLCVVPFFKTHRRIGGLFSRDKVYDECVREKSGNECVLKSNASKKVTTPAAGEAETWREKSDKRKNPIPTERAAVDCRQRMNQSDFYIIYVHNRELDNRSQGIHFYITIIKAIIFNAQLRSLKTKTPDSCAASVKGTHIHTEIWQPSGR